MEEISKKISAEGMKDFVKRLALASSRYKEKENAQKGLQRQIKKLKASALGRKTKDKIMGEFDILEKKINLVLEKEAEILAGRKGSSSYKSFKQEIEKNREEIDKIQDSITELKEIVVGLAQTKFGRETRIKKLEKKIKAHHTKKKALPSVSQKLEFLEKKYNAMKDDPRHSKSDLDRVKFRIDSLKLKATLSEF